MTKDELRRSLREKRKAFVVDKNREVPFPKRLLEHNQSEQSLGGYAATRWEADIGHWWPSLLEAGFRIALPYLADRKAVMDFREWDGLSALENAPFGFQQPAKGSVVIVPDILLVPLIGFDRKGNRLGQGAGHYDRYFMNNFNCFKIGVGLSCQEVDHIPTDPWDVPLQAIVTERDWIECSPKKDVL